MKRILLTLLLSVFTACLFSQAYVLTENFEGSPLKFTSTTTGTTGSWSLSSRVLSSINGTKYDSASVEQAKTIFLTSDAFSTVGNHAVYLYFDQICKVQFFDSAYIQVSKDNGVSWTTLTSTNYMGSSTLFSASNSFNEGSYPQWGIGNTNLPDSSWWKSESFDVSTILENVVQAKIRFVLSDGGSTLDGAGGRSGWFLDNIKVKATISELIPPTITMLNPVLQDTVINTDLTINAKLSDKSGVDSAICIYTVQPENITDTIQMTLKPNTVDSFYCSIPFYGFGRNISYTIRAVDSSLAHNSAVSPIYNFYCKKSEGGTGIIGTGTSSLYYPFYTRSEDSKTQMLYKASELKAAGITAGSIVSIAFDFVSSPSPVFNNFMVSIKSTNLNTLPVFETGLTPVYNGNYQPTRVGWDTITLNTPYIWDGVSNLVIQTCFDNPTTINTYHYVKGTSISSLTRYTTATGSAVCSATVSSALYSRPNIQFVLKSFVDITNDIGISSITNPIRSVIANTVVPVKVQIKNFGKDTLKKCTINWTVDGILQTPYNYTGSLASNSVSSDILIGSLNVAAGAHKLVVYTKNPNDSNDLDISNDTTSYDFYSCSGALSGTYTLGTITSDFPDFASAALGLNQCGVSGPVVFKVASGVYNEQISLGSIFGASSTNTVTFESSTGLNTDVILNYNSQKASDNYVVNLDGTSNITFKNMSFESQGTTYARVFTLKNTSSLDLSNNIIKTSNTPTVNAGDKMALILSLDTIGDNINISNNKLVNGSESVSLLGRNSVNWKINNNTILGQTDFGIELIKSKGSEIKGNNISPDSTLQIDNYRGIIANSNTGSLTISNNKIFSKSTNYGKGVEISSSIFDISTPAMIYNNFIQNYSSSSSANLVSSGIISIESQNIGVYYNNIRVLGLNSAAIILLNNTTNSNKTRGIDIKNNNLTNIGGGYIYYVKNADTSYWKSSNNNLFDNGTSAQFAYLNQDLTSFTDWISASGEKHTTNYNPYFLGATDLHVKNNLLNGVAVPIAGITQDIDGDLRNTTTPDIGADEFDPSPYDAAVLALVSPVTSCGLGSSETVILRIKNAGSTTISGNLTANYQLLGSSTIHTETVSATILPGDTLDYSFSAKLDLDVTSKGSDSTFGITSWVRLLNDNIAENDTIKNSFTSNYTPIAPTVTSPTNVSFGTDVVIHATSPDSLTWYKSDTSNIGLGIGSNYTTPIMYNDDSVYVGAITYGASDKIIGQENKLSTFIPKAPYYGYSYSQSIYDSQLLNGESGEINSLYYYYNGTPGTVDEAIKIYMGNTQKDEFNTNSDWVPVSDLTLVYDSLINILKPGWVEIKLKTPFSYNGDNNLVIAFNENTSGYLPGGGNGFYTTNTPKRTSLYYKNDYSDPNPAYPPSGYTLTYHPNIKINISLPKCRSIKSKIDLNIINTPADEASVLKIIEPDTVFNSSIPKNISVKILNGGTNTLSNVNINWMLNGVLQTPKVYTGSIASKDTATVVIATKSFLPGKYKLVAWTSLPNGVVDSITNNDTSSIYLRSAMHGTYTIGDTTGGRVFNYPNVTDAVSALSDAGISDNTTLLIDTGTFEESFVIPNILGVGPNAKILFTSVNGDKEKTILKYNTDSMRTYVIKIGSDYVTFDKLTIKYGDSLVKSVVNVYLFNTASNITISNCNLYGVKLNDASTINSRGIISCDNSVHNNIDIINNDIQYGTYGVALQGGALKSNINILNNNISNFNYTGISIVNNDSSNITGNTMISNKGPNDKRGVDLENALGSVKVYKNKIYLSPNGSYKFGYGIYVYNILYNIMPTNGNALIANNYITFDRGDYANVGLYINSSDNLDIYYNTVYNSFGTSTSKAIAVGSSNLNVNIVNNLFLDSLYYTLYVYSGTSINQIDYNNYFSKSDNLAYWGVNRTFASLKAASNKDVHSVNINPKFIKYGDYHLRYNQLSNMGTPTSLVLEDIDGEVRDTISPTIGADEVRTLDYDLEVSGVLGVTDPTKEAKTYPLSAVIVNRGLQTISSYKVSYSVNGATPIIVNINKPIAHSATDTVFLGNIISPANIYDIFLKSIYANDSNDYNDTLSVNLYGIPVKDAEIISINKIDEYCGMTYDTVKVVVTNIGQDTINGSGQLPTYIKYQNNNNTLVSELFSKVLAPGDTSVYKFNTLAYVGTDNYVDSDYTIKSWIDFIGDNTHFNDSVFTSATSLHVPLSPTSPAVSIPYATSTVLLATSTDSITWYTTATSTVAIEKGKTYKTPMLFQNDTFYVRSFFGSSGGDKTVGTAALTSTSNPMSMFYEYSYTQSIYTPSDFNNTFGKIDKIAYDFATGSVTNPGLDSVYIYMGLTKTSEFSTSDMIESNQLTRVFAGTINTALMTSGWMEIKLDKPFIYNGGDNLVIAFLETTPGYHGTSERFYATNYTAHRSIYCRRDYDPIDITAINSGLYSNYIYSGLPNTRFSMSPTGCPSEIAPVYVNVGNQLVNDIGLSQIIAPVDAFYLSDTEQVKVRVHNFGTVAQSNIPISYSLDGGAVVTETITSTIAANDSLDYTFNSKVNMLTVNKIYNLKVFSGLVNDQTRENDTIASNITSKIPDYCTASASYTTYEDITGVTIGKWHNSSPAVGSKYTDFTKNVPATQLIKGKTYPISISTHFTNAVNNRPCWVNVFMDLNRDGDFDDTLEQVYGDTIRPTDTIYGSLTIPVGSKLGLSRMRVVLRDAGDVTNTGPCGTFSYGEVEDYNIIIFDPINQDAGVESINSIEPLELDKVRPLDVQIRNYGLQPISSVDVSYILNGGAPVTTNYAQTINVDDSAIVNLGNISLEKGVNDIKVYTTLLGDSNSFNDTVSLTTYRELITSLPYHNDFEDTVVFRPVKSKNNEWERGIPNMSTINTAHSGTNVWGINLNGNYTNNAKDTLYTPKFVIPSSLKIAYLRFWNYIDTETNDGGTIEGTNANGDWITVGSIGDTVDLNWYNKFNGETFWSGTRGWFESSHPIDFKTPGEAFVGVDTIQFRFVFRSNSSSNSKNGWAIDDFEFTFTSLSNDVGVSEIVSPSSSVQTGSAQTVSIKVKNYGSTAQTSIPVSYKIDNGSLVTETLTIPSPGLLTDSTIDYTFTQGFTAPGSDFTICAFTDLSVDNNLTNDTLCSTILATPANKDAGVTKLSVSTIRVDTTGVVNPITVTITIKNFGLTTLTSIPVEYLLDGVSKSVETWSGNLAPDSSVDYVFSQTYMGGMAYYNACGTTNLVGDGSASNDKVCKRYFGINDVGITPLSGDNFRVSQNTPNPAFGKTIITYYIPGDGMVKIELRNSLGQLMLESESKEVSGEHNFNYNASKLESGVYYYTVDYKGKRITHKMIVNK